MLRDEPFFQFTAGRGSDAWQEGRQYYEKPWDELTPEEFDALDASERALVLEWRDRFGLATYDHEAAVHNVEPRAEIVLECAAEAVAAE